MQGEGPADEVSDRIRLPADAHLYLDKELAGHSLMQVIARVNRVYGEKPGGLVVDAAMCGVAITCSSWRSGLSGLTGSGTLGLAVKMESGRESSVQSSTTPKNSMY